ncbi:MAG TPA: Hsp20/alpha crystallin family protein [Parvularculaceae bacterium]|nr:Hsp20/alpha crystallin family protein [Parvularculaceae bacterium]
MSERASGDPFFRLQHEMNRLFDDAFAGFGAPSTWGAKLFSDGDAFPTIDLRETDETYEIEAELPGVSEKDIDVEVTDNVLTIRGEKRFERDDQDKKGYRLVERSFGSFARSIPLPTEVDPDHVDAVFKNGVLTLSLPKPPEAVRRSRRIEIKKG